MGNVGFQPFWPRYLAEAFLASCSLKLFSTLMKDARMSHISALLLSLSLSYIYLQYTHSEGDMCMLCMLHVLKTQKHGIYNENRCDFPKSFGRKEDKVLA